MIEFHTPGVWNTRKISTPGAEEMNTNTSCDSLEEETSFHGFGSDATLPGRFLVIETEEKILVMREKRGMIELDRTRDFPTKRHKTEEHSLSSPFCMTSGLNELVFIKTK